MGMNFAYPHFRPEDFATSDEVAQFGHSVRRDARQEAIERCDEIDEAHSSSAFSRCKCDSFMTHRREVAEGTALVREFGL